MKKLKIYQVDAFTNEIFRGNPAAVCPLTEWLPDQLMQKIAAENNLSETAFYVPEEKGFHIRWFTPTTEVNLCGHATLASAHVLFNHENYPEEEILFASKSGLLKVKRRDKILFLDFPSYPAQPLPVTDVLQTSLGKIPLEYFQSGNFGMAVFACEEDIERLQPDFAGMKKLEAQVLIVTAKGKEADFVSRVFGPKVGIDEDPVTGSAHSSLIPFWSERLKKQKMNAIQVSTRKGYLQCENLQTRVLIGGEAVTYLVGEIFF